jgi:DNA-binding CsgD family transcriptional regulator
MKTITKGGKTFQVKTITLLRSEFKKVKMLPKQYQARYTFDYEKHVREIIESVDDATCFLDNIVVRPYRNGYAVLDGHHRMGVLAIFSWESAQFDVLVGTEKDYFIFSRLANNEQYCQLAYSSKDRKLACADLRREGISIAEIAAGLGLKEGTVREYIKQGAKLRSRLDEQSQPLATVGHFIDGHEAQHSCLQLFNSLLNQNFGSWNRMRRFIQEKYNTTVCCTRAKDNELQSLDFAYHCAKHFNRPFRGLAITYQTTSKKNLRCQVDDIITLFREWYGDQFEAVDLMPELNRVDRRAILTFLDTGIVKPLESIEV